MNQVEIQIGKYKQMVPIPYNPMLWFLAGLAFVAALGVILYRKPVHACLSFLLTLLSLAGIYLQLSAEFIAIMQVLVYAGAILVIFMFVIILFQDAHEQLRLFKAQSTSRLLYAAGAVLVLTILSFAGQIKSFSGEPASLPPDFGAVEPIGKALYVDFFFPFEAVILLFLVAIIGALYMGKKEKI